MKLNLTLFLYQTDFSDNIYYTVEIFMNMIALKWGIFEIYTYTFFIIHCGGLYLAIVYFLVWIMLLSRSSISDFVSFEQEQVVFVKSPDQEGDGFVNAEEMKIWLHLMGLYDIVESIPYMMKNKDTNGDGKIDVDEFDRFMKG